jgi:hypothetical protein
MALLPYTDSERLFSIPIYSEPLDVYVWFILYGVMRQTTDFNCRFDAKKLYLEGITLGLGTRVGMVGGFGRSNDAGIDPAGVVYNRDKFAVTSIGALALVYKKPADGVLRKSKITDYIPEPGPAFIAASPFSVLSTATE